MIDKETTIIFDLKNTYLQEQKKIHYLFPKTNIVFIFGSFGKLYHQLKKYDPKKTNLVLLTNTNNSLKASRYIDPKFKTYLAYATDSQLVEVFRSGRDNEFHRKLNTQFQLESLKRIDPSMHVYMLSTIVKPKNPFFTTDLWGESIHKFPLSTFFSLNFEQNKKKITDYLDAHPEVPFIFGKIKFTTEEDIVFVKKYGARIIVTEGTFEDFIKEYVSPNQYIIHGKYAEKKEIIQVFCDTISINILPQTLNAVGYYLDMNGIIPYDLTSRFVQFLRNAKNAIEFDSQRQKIVT